MTAQNFKISSSAADGLILAVDLGSSGLRGALIDRRGSILARHALPLRVPADAAGRSEADPAHWWQMFQALASALSGAAPNAWRRVVAVSIGGLTRCQVLVAESGVTTRPALMWRDTRAAPIIEALRLRCPANHLETAELSAFHPLARIAWLGTHEPESLRGSVKVLEPKDFLNFKLSGVAATDSVSSARLIACAAAGPDGNLFDALGISQTILPRICAPLDQVGKVLPGLEGALASLAGAAVVAMAHDTWASVVGLGAMRPGAAYNLSGTTEVFGVIDPSPHTAPGLLSVDWTAGNWQLGGPSQSGADAVVWLSELLGTGVQSRREAGAALDALLAQDRQPEPVLFLPYLQGERVPWWDPDLRGAFVGLNRRHSRADLAWAVVEGVAFLNRTVLERAEIARGGAVSSVRFGGGGASSRLWRQAKADILNRDIICPVDGEEGLLGAAIAAWTSLGEFSDLAQAQGALVPTGQIVHPNPRRTEQYSRAYDLFRRTEDALSPISRELARRGRMA